MAWTGHGEVQYELQCRVLRISYLLLCCLVSTGPEWHLVMQEMHLLEAPAERVEQEAWLPAIVWWRHIQHRER